jgi:hypothetical protein
MVTVEPSFLAPITTPSMSPSFCELTCPVNAALAELSPRAESGAARNNDTAAVSIEIERTIVLRINVLP